MTAQVTQNTIVQPVRIKLPVAAFMRVAKRMIDRKQQRALQDLPDHLLRDIGLTRFDVENGSRDVGRPF